MRHTTSYVDDTYRNPPRFTNANRQTEPFFQREGEQQRPFFQVDHRQRSILPTNQEEGRALFLSAKEAHDNGNYEEAIRLFDRLHRSPFMISQSPENRGMISFNLAMAYYRNNDPENALAYFNLALAFKPDDEQTQDYINRIILEEDAAQPLEDNDIPSPEVITSTTQVENIGFDFLTGTSNIWSRQNVSFTDATRIYADRQSSHESSRPIPTRTIAPNNIFVPSWGINFSAIDYQNWSDMPAIAQYTMAEGSPFQRAMHSSFDHVVGGNGIENPTAASIRNGIMQAIHDMQPHLIDGLVGKLVVFMEGHGGFSGFAGVDENFVSTTDMMTMARYAQRRGIHITYILDSCNIGALVNEANMDHIEFFRGQILENAENHEEAEWANRQLDIAQLLRDDVTLLGNSIAVIYNWRADIRQAFRRSNQPHCSDGSCAIDENYRPVPSHVANFPEVAIQGADDLAAAMRLLYEHILEFNDELPADIDLLSEVLPFFASAQVFERLEYFTMREFGALRRPAAILIHKVNEIIRLILESVQTRLNTDSNAPVIDIDAYLAQ